MPKEQAALNIDQIKKLLPHRYPFLMVDKVIEIDKENQKIVAIKNVTINEPFFQGHFPDYPIMPGVLIIEAMAQVGGLLFMTTVENPKDYLTLFLGIDGARFKRQVRPGDVLRIEVQFLKSKGTIVKFKGKAYVEDELAAEAELLAALTPREGN